MFHSFQIKSKNKIDAEKITKIYEISIWKSELAKLNDFPSTEIFVSLITEIKIGIKIGNESIGNNAPFVFAFATIDAIKVEEREIENVPKKRVRKKIEKFFT